MKVVLASSNKGKIRELKALLAPLSIDIIPQRDLGIEDVDETGLTFVENALLKARHACQQSNLPAIADDSGICIDASHGNPGIYSARYAGPGTTDLDLIAKVLSEMQGVPDHERNATFHSVIVYLRHEKDPAPIIAHGIWPGRIIHEALGVQGFGYDPIFYIPDQQCTAAELDPELRNKISHRGRAMALLLCSALN